MSGEDDGLVNVGPMLNRINNWYKYLSNNNTHLHEADLIKYHTLTGRPLGNNAFINKLEVITGKSLVPGKPGRKPIKNK